MLTRILRPVSRVARTGSRQYHKETEPYKYSTMNDLPVPQGSWQDYYNKRQKLFNVHLAIGIVTFTATATLGYMSGAFYLNMGPKLPEGYVIKKYYD